MWQPPPDRRSGRCSAQKEFSRLVALLPVEVMMPVQVRVLAADPAGASHVCVSLSAFALLLCFVQLTNTGGCGVRRNNCLRLACSCVTIWWACCAVLCAAVLSPRRCSRLICPPVASCPLATGPWSARPTLLA